MDQLLKMAGDAGMTQEQGKAATGGIMSLAKKTLDSGDFSKIIAKVPEIEGLVDKHDDNSSARAGGEETSGGDGGGFMGSAMSIFSSSGAGGVADLLASLQKQGISPKEMNAFMPQLSSFIKSQCGVDINSVLGLSDGDASSAGGGGIGNAMGGLFGKK
jgi:hypothetical protein